MTIRPFNVFILVFGMFFLLISGASESAASDDLSPIGSEASTMRERSVAPFVPDSEVGPSPFPAQRSSDGAAIDGVSFQGSINLETASDIKSTSVVDVVSTGDTMSPEQVADRWLQQLSNNDLRYLRNQKEIYPVSSISQALKNKITEGLKLIQKNDAALYRKVTEGVTSLAISSKSASHEFTNVGAQRVISLSLSDLSRMEAREFAVFAGHEGAHAYAALKKISYPEWKHEGAYGATLTLFRKLWGEKSTDYLLQKFIADQLTLANRDCLVSRFINGKSNVISDEYPNRPGVILFGLKNLTEQLAYKSGHSDALILNFEVDQMRVKGDKHTVWTVNYQYRDAKGAIKTAKVYSDVSGNIINSKDITAVSASPVKGSSLGKTGQVAASTGNDKKENTKKEKKCTRPARGGGCLEDLN